MRSKAYSNMEHLARECQFKKVDSFSNMQLKSFPLRISFEKTGFLRKPKITYNDFNELSKQFLEIINDLSEGNTTYAVVLNGKVPDMPREMIYAYDCKTHSSTVPSEMLSLKDLTEKVFQETREVEIDVRSTIEEEDYSSCLDYFGKPDNMMFLYSQGDSNFKINLAQRISQLKLPKKFRFGATGFEFNSQ